MHKINVSKRRKRSKNDNKIKSFIMLMMECFEEMMAKNAWCFEADF